MALTSDVSLGDSAAESLAELHNLHETVKSRDC